MHRSMRGMVWALAAASILLVGGETTAQQAGRPAGPLWDPATVQTVTGTVSGERTLGRFDLVVVGLKTDAGSLAVVLAPKKILDPALQTLPPATALEVTGSKVKVQGREMLLASQVKVNGKEYVLRTPQGRPLGPNGQPLGRGGAPAGG